jgi:cytochrome d ubiquinol oxidase subunit II
VPVGNAKGNLFSSWLNPTSALVGVLAVATGAYLAAVYLSADARRLGRRDMEDAFRRRALGSGVVAGAVAVAGVVVLHGDAHALYDGLLNGGGLPALIVSGAAGVATLALVYARRFEPARYAAALAVAAIVAGWALAQEPVLLPGLTVQQAAAPHDTLVAIVVAVLAGAVVLFPSLGTLFRLVLHGRLDHVPADEGAPTVEEPRPIEPRRRALLVRVAAALLIVGVGLVNVADSHLAHGIGAFFFVGFVAVAFRAALPPADALGASH